MCTQAWEKMEFITIQIQWQRKRRTFLFNSEFVELITVFLKEKYEQPQCGFSVVMYCFVRHCHLVAAEEIQQ